jgi:RND family efflux transporter MFP subunit
MTAGLLALCLAGCDRSAEAPEVPVVRAVKTTLVAANDDGNARTFSGVLASARSARLAFAIGGRLIEVPLREGETFDAGQVVARLDSLDISREIAAAQARLSAARSRVTEAENNYARQRALADRGLIARATLDQYERERDTAHAERKVAETDLAVARDRLGKTSLVAASAGVVTKLVAKQYEEISAGAPVYEVGTGDSLEAEVLVPERLVTLLAPGRKVAVRLPGLDAACAAEIVEIGAEADSGNAFRVRARLESPPVGARSGMTAVVTIELAGGGERTFDLPLSALIFDRIETRPEAGASARLYVLDEAAGVVREREVRIAGLLGNRVLVGDGVAAGERVVVAGVAFLGDGMAARAWTPPE